MKAAHAIGIIGTDVAGAHAEIDLLNLRIVRQSRGRSAAHSRSIGGRRLPILPPQRGTFRHAVPKSTGSVDLETIGSSIALSRMPTALIVLFGLFGLGFGVGYAVRRRKSRMRRRSYYHDD